MKPARWPRSPESKNFPTQMGTIIHATDNYRRVVELVQSGTIGPVAEVHVWCDKSWGGGKRPPGAEPVPQTSIGTSGSAPPHFRPYHPCYLPANWRRYWEFGNGTLGDMACHLVDLPYWALKLRHPTTIAAEGPASTKRVVPTP